MPVTPAWSGGRFDSYKSTTMEEDEMQGENTGENGGAKAFHYKGVVEGCLISQGGVATSWSWMYQEESGKVSQDAIALVAGNQKA